MIGRLLSHRDTRQIIPSTWIITLRYLFACYSLSSAHLVTASFLAPEKPRAETRAATIDETSSPDATTAFPCTDPLPLISNVESYQSVLIIHQRTSYTRTSLPWQMEIPPRLLISPHPRDRVGRKLGRWWIKFWIKLWICIRCNWSSTKR